MGIADSFVGVGGLTDLPPPQQNKAKVSQSPITMKREMIDEDMIKLVG